MGYPHSDVSERWNTQTPRFWKDGVHFPEQNTHTPRFWKDGIYLFGTEYPHSEVSEKCSASFPFWKCSSDHFGQPTFLFWLQPENLSAAVTAPLNLTKLDAEMTLDGLDELLLLSLGMMGATVALVANVIAATAVLGRAAG